MLPSMYYHAQVFKCLINDDLLIMIVFENEKKAAENDSFFSGFLSPSEPLKRKFL